MLDYKIAAIVVTYNRKELLVKCINAILAQNYKPHTIFVVDNGSFLDTIATIKKKGLYNTTINEIKIVYVYIPYNIGPGGAFNVALRTAHDSPENFDEFWIMDDDGYPTKDCLFHLVKWSHIYQQLGPMVLNIDAVESLAFNFHGKFSKDELINHGEIIENYMTPFNGILYTRKLIDTIGYPIPELYSWGVELEFAKRAEEAGYPMITITSAIHFHPKDRMTLVNSIGKRLVVDVNSKWQGFCYWRNALYIGRKQMNIKDIIRFYIINGYYTLFMKKEKGWFKCFNDAFFAGLRSKIDNSYTKYL